MGDVTVNILNIDNLPEKTKHELLVCIRKE